MITAVIPTLMKPVEPFRYLLGELQQSKSIAEIIVIDNTEGYEFNKVFGCTFPKVKVVAKGENTFVNPAWNLGISMANTKYYLAINDDILCKNYIFDDCLKILENDESIGILTAQTVEGIAIEQYNKQYENYDEVINVSDLGEQRIGWFYLGKVEEWQPIPSQLKVYFGDDLVYLLSRKRGKRNKIITNRFINHFRSFSSGPFAGHNPPEAAFYNQYIKNI